MGIEQQLSSLNQNRGGVVFNLGPTLDVELEKQDMHPEALLVAAGSMTYYAMPLTNNRIPTFFDIRNSLTFFLSNKTSMILDASEPIMFDAMSLRSFTCITFF